MPKKTHTNTPSAPPPSPFLGLQWHITDRCNWRCKHCYHDRYEGDELTLPELKRVFDEYIELVQEKKLESHIKVTGGEPFVRADTLDFLEYISRAETAQRNDCVILTNGSLFTDELLTNLKKRAPAVRALQLSIEGEEVANDAIRGKGAFATILAAAAKAQQHGFRVVLALTLSKLNYEHVTGLLDLLTVYRIPLLIRRFVPLGQGLKLDDVLIPPKKLRAFFKRARALNQEHFITNRFGRTEGLLNINSCLNGIQFFDHDDGTITHKSCDVRKHSLITIMPNGDVYPCRLLPITIGNVRQQSLREIYDGPGYRAFLQPQKQEASCKSCTAYTACQGGAMCISHAVTGSVFARDPECWAPHKK